MPLHGTALHWCLAANTDVVHKRPMPVIVRAKVRAQELGKATLPWHGGGKGGFERGLSQRCPLTHPC